MLNFFFFFQLKAESNAAFDRQINITAMLNTLKER